MSEERARRRAYKATAKNRIAVPYRYSTGWQAINCVQVKANRRDGILEDSSYIDVMNIKSSSPKSRDLQERKRLAAEEGAKALAEYAAHDIAVRNNMVRLRALRAAAQAKMAPADSKKPRKRSMSAK